MLCERRTQGARGMFEAINARSRSAHSDNRHTLWGSSRIGQQGRELLPMGRHPREVDREWGAHDTLGPAADISAGITAEILGSE